MTIDAALRRFVADLRALQKTHALVGGLAVSARTVPRFTADVDIAVAVSDDAEAETLVYALQGRGYQVLSTVEHEGTHRLATARLMLSGLDAEPVLDLLFATSGIETEIANEAEAVNLVEGLELSVARVGHLVAMKLLSRSEERPLDGADLLALRAELSDDERRRAREAVRLIEERGYARGRDLVRALEHFL